MISVSKPLIFTPSHFFKYDTQPLWLWYDQFGDQSKKEEISEFTLKLMENGVVHEDEYIAGLEVSKVDIIDPEEAMRETVDLMQKGVELIYQGCLQVEIDGVLYRGRPDLLEKRKGSSIFGDWYYAPIEIKWSSKIKTTYKHQLAHYSITLEKVQGYFPKDVSMINRYRNRLSYELTEKDVSKAKVLTDQILDVMRGMKPAITITSKSKNSPWFKVALEEAEEKQDVALIYRLDSRSLDALKQSGIFSIQDMISADLTSLPKIPYASLETLKRAQLQAKSLIEKQIIPIGKLDDLPNTALKLYFDIEGDPLLGIDYLFGFWVSGDEKHLNAKVGNVRFYEDGKYFIYFLAKKPEDEAVMWKSFLEWIACLPEKYTVYHYANYEKSHLKSLMEEYGGSTALELFQDKLVDLQKVIEKAIIFPLYFYSIKDIAKSSFLSFKWRHQKAGGGQSVFWYEEWLETCDKEILDDIINYNEDDVRATECLYLWYQNNINLNKSLACLIKTKELIFYSIQLTDAVQRGIIRPEHLGKCFTVPEPHSNNQFSFELDWTQHPEIFKQTADDAQVSITSHAIIVCKESYHPALRVKKEENSDLYGAQMILKFVRDAMGHMKAESNNYAIPYWRIDDEKKRTIYEVKKIGMIFNAETLHEKPFKFSHIGGLSNLVKLLDFLIQDLRDRLKINNL